MELKILRRSHLESHSAYYSCDNYSSNLNVKRPNERKRVKLHITGDEIKN